MLASRVPALAKGEVLSQRTTAAEGHPKTHFASGMSLFVFVDLLDAQEGRVEAGFGDLGDQSLKNIARPVRVYRIELEEARAEPPATAPAAPAAFALPDGPSIAVLPFQNMSGDAEQDYFCDGLVEDIITTLSKLAGLRVIARNSTFVYKGRSVDVRDAAKQLGVRYVLEGSVRKSGNRSGSRRN